MNQAQLIGAIKAHIAKGDKAADKAEQHYIAAGQHLKTLKAQHGGSWAEWEALLKDRVGIGKSRASELMLIADGTKTLAEVRADTAKRTADAKATSLKSALKSSATSGETRKPEFSISQVNGQYHVDITTDPVHAPDCHDPNCGICKHCGGKLVRRTYKCLSAEDSLRIIQAFSDPETYAMLREIQSLYMGGMHHLRELAQFIVSHPYTDTNIAEWLERDPTEVKELRHWAKNGFKGEPPDW